MKTDLVQVRREYDGIYCGTNCQLATIDAYEDDWCVLLNPYSDHRGDGLEQESESPYRRIRCKACLALKGKDAPNA